MKSVLAIFAKTPSPGRVKTRLSPPLSPRQSAEFYRCMLLDTIRRVRSLDVDTVIFYEGEEAFFREAAPEAKLIRQEAGDLGVRLERAFDALEGFGYGPRIVIGTDAPDLPLEYIQDALQALKAGSGAVFGPASDGGYYLVGVREGYGELFREIPWSSERVLEASLVKAEASGLSAALLSPWYDVDSYDDLLRPGLVDPGNGADLTRAFLGELGIGSFSGAGAARQG